MGKGIRTSRRIKVGVQPLQFISAQRFSYSSFSNLSLLVLLSIMLSRFSALLVYVVAGLVISAAATPMGQSADYNDEPKSRPPGAYGPQSYPPHHKYPQDKPYSKPYDHAYKAYGGGEDKPYSKPYPEEKKYPEKKYPRDKKHPEEKPHPEDKDRKSDYDNKDGKSGQCAVEHQHCCDSIDSVTQARARGILTPVLTLIDITGNAHTNCSPYYSTTGGKACTAQTVCCDNAEFYGAIAIGCTNVNL